MQAYRIGLEHCPKTEELDNLCTVEITLIFQIIPFVYSS